MDLNLIVPAFIAGLLTFLAPCTFSLVPEYLGFISGIPLAEKQRSDRMRLRIFLNGLFFCAGI